MLSPSYQINVAALEKHYRFLMSVFAEPRSRLVAKNLAGWLIPLLWQMPKQVIPCDVLVLHATALTQSLKRDFISALSAAGVNVVEEILASWRGAVTERQLAPLDYAVPRLLMFKASYARHLVQCYRPRVLMTFMEGDVLTSFLRYEANQTGGKLVNCAHSITFNTDHFTMADFDYYFLLGRGSLENLRNNPRRYGSTKAVLTGSLNLSGLRPLEPIAPNNKILYFSTWIDPARCNAYLDQFEQVVAFARDHPRFTVLIKKHPTESHGFWKSAAKTTPNIVELDAATTMLHAVEPVCLTLSNSSSATPLDSILLNRVPLVIDPGNFATQWYQAYPHLNLLPGETLSAGIARVLGAYDFYLAKAREFLDYNLEHKFDSVDVSVAWILAILQGTEDFECFPIASSCE